MSHNKTLSSKRPAKKTSTETGEKKFQNEIKKLKQQIAALENEHFMFQGLLKTIPDNIYFKDRKSRFLYISGAMENWFRNHQIDEIYGKTDFDMFTEEHAREAYEDEQKIMESGVALKNKEERETWEDGTETWVSTSKAPLYNEDNSIIGIVGISRDITEKKITEAKLKLYRQNLEAAKQETDNILANVDEGLFLLDKDLRLGKQYSKELESILYEISLSSRPLIDILKNKISSKDVDSVKRFLDLLFDEQNDADMLQELNPLVKIPMHIGGLEKYLTFKFKRIFNQDGHISHLITTVNDVTREVMLAKSLEESRVENKRKMDWMLSILNNDPAMLNDFIKSAEEELDNAQRELVLLEKNLSQENSFNLIYRSIHTIKGNASLLDLDFFAEAAHDTETILNDLKEQKSGSFKIDEFSRKLDSLIRMFEELKALINQISGIHEQFRPRRDHEHKMLIHSLEKLAERLCENTDKKIQINFDDLEAGNIPFQYKLMIRDILVQMIRNTVAHGLEPEKVRLQKGKPETGNIWISANIDNNVFKLSYKDDGKGLNLAKLKEKALALKNHTKAEIEKWNDHQIGELIFEPGISTIENTDMTAGRGVGMDIIKKKIEKTGGSIVFETKRDMFISFFIEIPLKKNKE